MRITDCLLAVAAVMCEVLGQQSGSPESAPSEDAVDLRQDGGYGFRYRARDQGGHYGEAVATPDNTVSGRFGYREPGTGRVLETQYTAGERGFRARGPTVHRRMDLSQVKIPYNPPVSPDSPDYNPTYSTYYDPNEDSSYHFDFATNEYKRTETGGPLGQIGGAYSYVDDVGDIHNVEFEAGSQTGFHVKTPFPDSNHNYNELYFRGDGKVPLRGRTSIQRGLDGSYRFTTHSQDQRRSEVKDAQGNTRGSYTYIDKDGVQRTVQYIAGPNIGYKIVNQGLGPNLDPQFPYINQNYIPPILQGGDKPNYGSGGVTTSPLFNVDGGGSGSGIGLGDIGGNDGFGIGTGTGAGKPPKGPKPPRPTSPPFGFDSTSPPTVGSTSSSDKFGQSGSSFGEGGSSFGEGGSSFGGGGSSFGDVGSSLGGGESAFGSSGGGGRPSGGGGRPSGGGGRPSGGGGRPFGGGESTFGGNGNSQRPDGNSGGNTPRPPSSCCPISGNDKGQGIGFSSEKEGSGVGSGSQTGEPPYPPSGLKPANGLSEPNFTPNKHKPSSTNQGTPSKRPIPVNDFLSPTSGYPPYHAGFPEEETPKPFEKPSFKPFTVEDNLFLQRPFSSLPPAGSSSRFHPDRTDDFHNFNSFTTRPEYIDDILEKDGAFSEDEFTGFPPGISVKGRIQSLDINPFGTKVPAPGDALEQFNNEPISSN